MIYSMHIRTEQHPAMLERILRCTRVRGFELRHLEVESRRQEQRLSLTVESNRAEALLREQLRKIPGVRELSILHDVETTAAQAHA